MKLFLPIAILGSILTIVVTDSIASSKNSKSSKLNFGSLFYIKNSLLSKTT